MLDVPPLLPMPAELESLEQATASKTTAKYPNNCDRLIRAKVMDCFDVRIDTPCRTLLCSCGLLKLMKIARTAKQKQLNWANLSSQQGVPRWHFSALPPVTRPRLSKREKIAQASRSPPREPNHTDPLYIRPKPTLRGTQIRKTAFQETNWRN